MKEEDNIRKKVGGENPFKVPEGYFDGLTSQVMASLPEREPAPQLYAKPTLWHLVRPWLYMAAMFVGAALIINVASSDKRASTESLADSEEADLEMEYINTAVDNSLLDDYSLYEYLADSSAE